MADFVAVAKVSDIPLGQGKTVDLGGTPVAVFNYGEGFCAVHDTCPHAGGPLSEGEFDGATVSCPWHGWTFDVTTGCNVDGGDLGAPRFDVRVEAGQVCVKVG
jgi:nitrite reductase/ring-hydroxylating ferredoxin subunit